MLVKILKEKNQYKLVLLESIPEYTFNPKEPLVLMVVRRMEDKSKYMIIDYRHTDEHTAPTEYLEDVPDMHRQREELFKKMLLEKKDEHITDFFFRDRTSDTGIVTYMWHDFNGIVFENPDIVFDPINDRFQEESYLWQYKGAMKKLYEARDFWENYHETNIEKARIIKKHRPDGLY